MATKTTTARTPAKAVRGQSVKPTPPGTSAAARAAAKALNRPAKAEPAEPPRLVNGLVVVSSEPVLSPLPPKPGQTNGTSCNMNLLTLFDGSKVYECGECANSGAQFTGTRGEVIKHRTAKHGMRRPHRKSSADTPTAAMLNMTVGEMYELAQAATQWGNLLEQRDRTIESWKARCLAAEQENRRIKRAMGVAGFVRREDTEDED